MSAPYGVSSSSVSCTKIEHPARLFSARGGFGQGSEVEIHTGDVTYNRSFMTDPRAASRSFGPGLG